MQVSVRLTVCVSVGISVLLLKSLCVSLCREFPCGGPSVGSSWEDLSQILCWGLWGSLWGSSAAGPRILGPIGVGPTLELPRSPPQTGLGSRSSLDTQSDTRVCSKQVPSLGPARPGYRPVVLSSASTAPAGAEFSWAQRLGRAF